VAVSSAGEAVAIWGASYDEESGIGASTRPPKGPWKGGGRLGYPGPFPAPELAVTSKGEAVAVWVKEPQDDYGSEIQAATRKPGGKWKIKTLSPKEFGSDPEIVTEPGGRATVNWVKGSSFEKQTIVASTHLPGGAWGEPVSLSGEGLQMPVAAESRLAVAGAGESIAVWVPGSASGEGTTIEASSRPSGQPWSEPTAISTTPAGPLYGAPDLDLTVAPSGEAFAVWRCFDGSGWVIKTATRPAAGPSQPE
jgi:hypothetical protein